MVILIKVNGNKIKHMVMGSMYMQKQVQNIKDIGKKICNMVQE